MQDFYLYYLYNVVWLLLLTITSTIVNNLGTSSTFWCTSALKSLLLAKLAYFDYLVFTDLQASSVSASPHPQSSRQEFILLTLLAASSTFSSVFSLKTVEQTYIQFVLYLLSYG